MKKLCRHGISLFALVLASPLFASDFNCTYIGGTHDWTDPAAWTGCNGGYPDNSISVSTYSVLLSSGALSLTQPIDIDAYTQTSTSSSTSNGLTGAGDLTTSGLFSWTTGGSTSYRSNILTNGTVTANGGMTLGGSGTKYLGTNTTLINATGQTANFTNGTLQIDGTFENQAGAIL